MHACSLFRVCSHVLCLAYSCAACRLQSSRNACMQSAILANTCMHDCSCLQICIGRLHNLFLLQTNGGQRQFCNGWKLENHTIDKLKLSYCSKNFWTQSLFSVLCKWHWHKVQHECVLCAYSVLAYCFDSWKLPMKCFNRFNIPHHSHHDATSSQKWLL